MTSWSAASWASNKIVLWIGCSKNFCLPSCVNRSWTLRIRPSLLWKTLVTRVSGHWFLGKSSSWRRTISPTLLSRWGVFHLRLCWNCEEYSERHLIQNWLAKNCTWRHLFLEYKSNRSKQPGGAAISIIFHPLRMNNYCMESVVWLTSQNIPTIASVNSFFYESVITSPPSPTPNNPFSILSSHLHNHLRGFIKLFQCLEILRGA